MFRVWVMSIRCAGAVRPAGPAGVHEPDGDVITVEPIHQQLGVDAGMPGQERRAEARRERRRRLLDPDLRPGQLGRVAADEVVGGLLPRQPRDRRQDPERVRGQEDHVARRARDPGRIGVADEVQRVRAAGVLGELLRVQVQLARHRVDVDVLEDRPEAPRRREDVGLVGRREADRLGVAAALEVEDVVAAPAVLVVADQAPQRDPRRGSSCRSPRGRRRRHESPSLPTFTDECIGSTPSSGSR